MKALVKSTGELIEFEPETLEELMQTWKLCKEYIEAYTKVKDQLKPLVDAYVNDKGVSDPVNGYVFKVIPIQRMNYDKSVMRQVFDEDTFDQFLEPNKSAIDKFLKDNLAKLGTASTELRQSMIPSGRPYTQVKAEKVERSE